MWRRSIGFCMSIAGGIMSRVMQSHAAQRFAQSCGAGTPKGEDEKGVLGTNSPLVIYVGRCTSPDYVTWRQGEAFGAPWVIAQLMEDDNAAAIPQHSCLDDHVKQGGDERVVHITHETYSDQIALCLEPCPLNPGNTFVLSFKTKLDENSTFWVS